MRKYADGYVQFGRIVSGPFMNEPNMPEMPTNPTKYPISKPPVLKSKQQQQWLVFNKFMMIWKKKLKWKIKCERYGKNLKRLE